MEVAEPADVAEVVRLHLGPNTAVRTTEEHGLVLRTEELTTSGRRVLELIFCFWNSVC